MVDDNTTLHFTNTIPGFLNCSHRRLGSLPGCLFKYDSVDEQCADGREGEWRYSSNCTRDDLYTVLVTKK